MQSHDMINNPNMPKATMERFLSDIAREKPTRFSPNELAQSTNNFSKVLGSGGFGVVYKGEFPNGIHVAVKVLKGDISKRVEEQFMAEVSTMCKTYHINLVRLYGCRGTPGYAAPELWSPYPVTHKCDVYSFGMLLFEVVGRRRNHDINLSGKSQEWLPRWAYERFEKRELGEMLSLVGVHEEDKKKADIMVKVALWCVQYLPNSRPTMSSVVKMLEGGVEIDSPPNPFGHLEDNLVLSTDSSIMNSKSTNGSHSSMVQSHNDKYDIQIVNTI
ncbi:hypothetical protein BVRB_6g146580 isoform B [Beta vulgaris subsp. vulgaris]|nr:hypothetical protein BVRB_6g146580 isoform B [Beta vulgaris subsp. vulgaris]